MSQNSSAKPVEKRSEFRNNVVTMTAAILLVLGTRTAIAEPRYIPSESMLPTLKVQDRILVEKISLHFNPPRRGDILVFDPPFRHKPQGPWQQLALWQGYGDYTPLIKRVVGLPGETIAIQNGHVLINGKALNESGYKAQAPAYDFGPIKIPAGQLFMMGDNRNNSADSHIWGPLPIANVRGRAVLRFWPLDAMGEIDAHPSAGK